jgi:hypothetical protein
MTRISVNGSVVRGLVNSGDVILELATGTKRHLPRKTEFLAVFSLRKSCFAETSMINFNALW